MAPATPSTGSSLRNGRGNGRSQNAAKFGFTFPLSHEPWHMEVAGARGSRGGPPVVQNASGIGEHLTVPVAERAGSVCLPWHKH